MKASRELRRFTSFLSHTTRQSNTTSDFLHRLYSAEPQRNHPPTPNSEEHDAAPDTVFDSSKFDGVWSNNDSNTSCTQNWDQKYRERVNEKVFGEHISDRIATREEVKKKKAVNRAKALLEAALDKDVDMEGDIDPSQVKEEDQKSLAVGIIGAPNAGKSALTNYMVGTKVSAVSRKTNTTTSEVLGVLTKGDTQVCFFDTPGLMLKKAGFPCNDIKIRNESAWSSVSLYDVLIVIFDVHRHLTRPDSRVVRLIEKMGSDSNTNQKHILCLNKVDLVVKKKEVLKVLDEFKDLPGFVRHFMISGVKVTGVKDLSQYLLEQIRFCRQPSVVKVSM